SLTSISIPTSVTRLSSYALYGCSGLTEIFLHAGITLIDDFALAMCSGISSVTLPSGATLGAGALSGCSALNSLTLKGILPLHNLFGTVYYDGSYQVRQGNKYYYLPEALTMLTIRDTAVIADSLLEGFSAVSTLTLPTYITRVGNYAFYGLQLLNELALPATLTEVGDFAFYDNKKVNFIIPTNNIQTVGRGAFQNCYALVSFNTPSVISIGAGAFSGCYALASLGIRMGKVVGEYFGQQMYVGSYAAVQRIGEVDMTYYIPSALTQITVYGGGALSAYMLSNMSKLNTVSLLGETSIPATAFIGCTAVTSLTGADIVYIEKDALLPLPWLATHIASRPNNTLVYIGRVAYVFKGVMDIGANISFIDGTTQLYAGAFANQSRLIRVNVPSSMRYIDITAFDGCTAMNYITVDAANEYFSSLSGILYNKAGDTLIYRPLAMA
ncbi:MAG: leucine-rich repeat domain-containing protein, partial [Clostridia bacterium]|nr:leucine-rich repeat domain-containing protein [Clostridia bacterium]